MKVNGVTKGTKIMAKKESPMMGTKSRSGLMTINTCSNHKNTNRQLPDLGIEDVRPHLAFCNLVINVSNKSAILQNQTIIGVGTEPPDAVFTL